MFDCLNIINIVGNMTIEEKAKAYDEALERAKAYHRNELAGSRKEMMEYIFPQLCESDDEKIRKALIDGVSQIRCKGDVTREQMIAYLERQKEQPISAEEVLARAGLKPYKDGNKWCILAGDNIQEGICGFGDTIDEALYQFLLEVLEKQKEQKPISFNEPYNPRDYEVVMEENATSLKRKEQKLIEDVVKDITKNKESAIKFLKSAGIMDDNGELAEMYRSEQKPVDYDHEMWKNCEANFEGGKKEVIDHPEKYGLQKEQMPAECINIEELAKHIKAEFESFRNLLKKKGIDYRPTDVYWTDYARLFVSSAKKLQKSAEWSEEDEIHVRSIFGDFRQDVVPDEEDQDWLKKKLESLRLQPMDEWSEEDEVHRNFILESLENQIRFCKKDAKGAYYAKQIRTAQNWLKSLCPSWKPSEEQMNCLCAAVDAAIRKHNESVSGYEPARVLKSLYEDLQKL